MNTGAKVIVNASIPDTWISTMKYFAPGQSTFAVAGAASLNPVQLFSTIRFPTSGSYNVSFDTAFSRLTGGVGNDTHGTIGLSSITQTTWSALPYINDNGVSTFTTLNMYANVSTGYLTRNIVFMDKGVNTWTGAVSLGNPRIQYIPNL